MDLLINHGNVLPGLGQQRLMPPGVYSQDKAIKQEERLIERLQSLDMDTTLVAVLRKQTVLLLEGELQEMAINLMCTKSKSLSSFACP